MQYQLLVGSNNFWSRARQDIAAAQNRVFIQAMTFEGDAAGQAVAAALSASPARDRRVLVDDYTRHNLNDTMLRFSGEAALLAEAEATWAMFDGLAGQGVGVRITDPVGRNPLRFAGRNHKKLLVMDEAAWIGGINFSDHNYEWHDFMVRIEDRALADWLAAEFNADWQGEPVFRRAEFGPGLTMLSMDGVTNGAGFAEVLAAFDGARRSIEVLSAYPTMPFTDAMARAARRGIEVVLHTPRANNKPIIRDYLLGTAPQAGIDLRLIDRMTHAKAALIDGELLMLGSSNFDFVSWHRNNEFVALVRDRALIELVEEHLLGPARAESAPPRAEEMRGWAPLKARLVLAAAHRALPLVKKGARIAEWRRP